MLPFLISKPNVQFAYEHRTIIDRTANFVTICSNSISLFTCSAHDSTEFLNVVKYYERERERVFQVDEKYWCHVTLNKENGE